ncbi:hypothetical protein [Methylocella tundrae]|uniref:Uncharacterized protein n=1 Tax=Methylocella tundrae TaxID=227605 RepID=A0A4U8Z7N4_METTU|nr:hypothetical protein [Methylocella tundrae]WPP02770.1 hypothetical protein SIN04_00235 [Methylocella tundrae]VFU17541.1 conserved protein of unknown function [Methylocella tundrae]
MANKRSGTAAPAKAAKPAKASVTIEIARLLCPAPRVVENIANTFGLSVPDFDGIRESHESAFRKMWHSFDDALNEKATMMHFQRIAGSLVSSAVGAGRFYSEKVSAAKDLTSRLANDHRDEDRDAPVGFDSKAQRAREFAADMAMQAYALLAAAEGAVSAYQEITGEEWKAYQAPTQGPATVERRSAAAEVNAFTA